MPRILALLLAFAVAAVTSAAAERAGKPNIIVIFTDDHGYADLGCQGVRKDVRTPHLDALAAGGVRMTSGYITAPQCVPSRAGLLTGRYQNEFGLESNTQFQAPGGMDGFMAALTIPERLKKAGYATGMAGKWHLGPGREITKHGFDQVFYKNSNRPGTANFGLDGKDRPLGPEQTGLYHLDACSAAACAFVERHRAQPFFFYLAYRAPHVPLDAPKKYLDRFPGKMPERRRQALAMLSAVDDGVGRVVSKLDEHKILENTLIFFISDNGAPLKIHKRDAPGGGPGWDGSLNDPMNGEKGMLSEGGIRTPFVAHWKGTIPSGQVYNKPVISLDVAATANALAGLDPDPVLKGVNLVPYLTGQKKDAPHESLYWRWRGQAAIRKGQWKYLAGGDREYLYNLESDAEEKRSVLAEHADVAKSLRAEWDAWSATLEPPGLPAKLSAAAARYFDFYLDGKEPAPAPPRQQKDRRKGRPQAARDAKAAPPVAAPVGRPNVIFILADDLGWADTTLYGHTKLYETPNLARLAARGMTYTRAYANSALCSPTRASILTGQTTARHGSTAPAHHTAAVRLAPVLAKSAPPGSKALMPLTVTRLVTTLPTLGKLVRGAGYRTAHFGKWHLGPEPYSPLEHGFEIDLPHHPGPGPAGSFVAPWKFRNFTANKPKEHIEDRMASEAARWIRSVKDEPFFMNYWQFSVHAPFDAKEELIAQYREKVNPKSPQRSPTYAAMVHSLDDAVGTLLDAVEAAGIAERTAFVFLSDNGGNMYNEVDGTTPTSNRPLRGGKATIYEGGIRVPCVVAWPGVTKAGTRSDEIVQSSDFYPTILKHLGIPLPVNHHIDGIDLTPALRGGKLAREGMFTYFPHAPAVPDWLPPSVSVHRGDWKLIRLFHQGEKGAHRHHLYNLRDDLGEANNLAGAKPELVAELDRLIESHLNEAGTVVPVPNPQFDPAKYRPELEGVGKLRGQPRGKR